MKVHAKLRISTNVCTHAHIKGAYTVRRTVAPTHAHMITCTKTRMHAVMHKDTNTIAQMHRRSHPHMHTCTQEHTHMQVHRGTHACICTYAYMYASARTHFAQLRWKYDDRFWSFYFRRGRFWNKTYSLGEKKLNTYLVSRAPCRFQQLLFANFLPSSY